MMTLFGSLHRTSGVSAACRQLFTYPAMFSVLFAGSLVSSLFFNGSVIEYFALSMLLLCLLTLIVLWRGYDGAFSMPLTALPLLLALFWAWLALGLLWSRVPYVSMVNFWWVGSFALVFWLTTLTSEAERCWLWASRLIFLIGFVLAATGLYQLLVLGGDPRSTFLSRNSHAAFLILIAIPASTHFLSAQPNRWQGMFACLLFVFFLGIAVTGSRGVLLSLLLAVGVVAAVAYRHVPTRRLLGWLTIILGAYLLANSLLQGWLGGRLSTILEPSSAGQDRFLIWRQAWQMVVENPWLGIGLGTYWLFWPPYRHPADSSAGFYVHNDYLQIWIETGLPGLLLLLAIEVAVVVIFIRTLRNAQAPVRTRIEMAGLVGGLAAIAFHTFFDFDLYIHPILLMIGLLLARLHFLQHETAPASLLVLQPARRMGARGYHTITSLLMLFPILYFASLGYSAWLTVKARDYSAKGLWVEASSTLSRAWQMMPTSDLTLITHADMLRQVIPILPKESTKQRQALYSEAELLLAEAERVNPVRSLTFYLRGLLYQMNPDLAGPGWPQLAAEAYAQTLRIDPRTFLARVTYARMLLGLGRMAEARSVLEAGIDYWYPPDPNVFAYYQLTAHLRRRGGDRDGAMVLEQKIERLVRGARAARTSPFGAGGPDLKIDPLKSRERATSRP